MLRSENSSWLNEYWKNDECMYRDLDADDDYDMIPVEGRFEIVFKKDGTYFYCFVDASSMDEALGNFFRHHSDVTYEDIVEHIEI